MDNSILLRQKKARDRIKILDGQRLLKEQREQLKKKAN